MEKEIDHLRQERMSATAEVVCARGLVEKAARDISVAVASKISMRNELILALLEHSVARYGIMFHLPKVLEIRPFLPFISNHNLQLNPAAAS